MEEVKSIIQQAFAYENMQLRVYGTEKEPWFCGVDVARILGYANAFRAVDTIVLKEHKKTLLSLSLDIPIGMSNIKLSANDRKTIYINESGLYTLITRSRLEKAVAFQRWLFEEVIPTIRRTGAYVSNSISAEEINKLKAELEEKDKLIKKIQRREEVLSSFVANWEAMKKEQWFYLATNEALALSNRFKFGGVRSSRELVQRLRSYNTGA